MFPPFRSAQSGALGGEDASQAGGEARSAGEKCDVQNHHRFQQTARQPQ